MTENAEIRLSLFLKPLPIPYPAAKHDNGENFGYKSLINDPSAIEQIPELDSEPDMKTFIAKINAKTGRFETIRMLHWFSEYEGAISQCLCFGFIFRDRLLFANYGNYLLLAGRLLEQIAAGTLPADQPPLLEIRPAHLLDEHASGWIMDIYLAGNGTSKATARQRLAQVMQAMDSFFQIDV